MIRRKTFTTIIALCIAAALAFPTRGEADELPKEAVLPLPMATKAVQAAMEACKKDGYRVSVSVVDRAGVLRAMGRADGAGPHTVESSRKKAYTAASLRRPTSELAELIGKMQTLQALRDMLDGSIPVIVTTQGIGVKDGIFEARPPGGVIQYAASPDATHAVTEANASMHIVLQALSNFHYNVLQVRAQYAENGTLQLQARLEGKNPDQKEIPPVHFNLTVQENVPALLKSLRLVNNLEDSVRSKFSRPSM